MHTLWIWLACVFAVPAALGQDYPSKPAPGGGYDFTGRLLAEQLTHELGQPFVVENRVGGGTVLGTQTAATAAPDGYARANPGKLSIATSGVGTGQHVSALLLKRFANIDLLS